MIRKISDFISHFGKKKLERDQAKLFLAASSDSNIFFAYNGMMIRSLYELRDAFITMSEETYQHHTQDNKNDFSAWIRDVHKDEQLAHDVIQAKNAKEAFNIIDKRIAYLKKLL